MLPRVYRTNLDIVSAFVALRSQSVALKSLLRGVNTIGAVRVSLAGLCARDDKNTLKQLHFFKVSFANHNGGSQNPNIQLPIMKIIDIKEGLNAADRTQYSGERTPTFVFDTIQVLHSEEQYSTQEIIF